MELYDVVIIGCGIQGMILSRQIHKLNKNLKLLNITNSKREHCQTFKSQFYLHRGHFYKDVDLTTKLNNTFDNWCNLVQDLQLKTYENRSFIGFQSDCNLWVDNWLSAKIPFMAVDTNNLMGYSGRDCQDHCS